MVGVIAFGVCALGISIVIVILQVKILKEVGRLSEESENTKSEKAS